MTNTIIAPVNAQQRDVQIAEIGTDTMVLRSRTWDRLKFEIEYSRQKGTTANSYLIKGDGIAVIDPPGESFTQIYLQALKQHLNLADIEYIILNHVNPNRMVTLKALIEQADRAKIICSRPGANAIEASFPEWETKIQVVRDDDTLDLGRGHQLQFSFVPTPRWPDGLFTYDRATNILYTDKFFGVHVCDNPIFDENWKQLDEDRRHYFDCLHASQAKQVEAALDKIVGLKVKLYATGHGPLVRYSLSRLGYDYRAWCQQQSTQELKVALLYASAYGNTAIVANAIAQGLINSGVAVESINCELSDPTEITEAIKACDGFIIGSPTLGGHAPTQIQTALGIVLSNAAKTKLAGVFGSYGWSGEAIDLLEEKLKDANYSFGFQPIRVRFSPTEPILQECENAGIEFAQSLKKSKKLRTPRQAVTEAQLDRTEQAVGRIVGSLCIIATKRGDTHCGILTSLVSQATFNPPGLMIAIGEDRHAEAIANSGNKFVLNILKEGRNVRKHFSYQVSDRENPFANISTQTASNGCLVINEALAYLECTVQNRMECGDRTLVYATIDRGEVLESEGVTAITHRKSGSHY
jgi:flavorubredoxin/flavin reductase (DIM6/NTAB) family NADH-FMN oxidoreductase RutF